MRQRDRQQSPGMSPLAQRLRSLNDNGLSYREMERLALARGVRYTSSSFEQVAKDQRADRLGVDALHALSIVLKITPEQVAELDDQRWGLREHVASSIPEDEVDLARVATEKLLAELAKRTGGR